MHEPMIRTLLVVCLLATGGCGNAPLPPLPDGAVILAFGDSLTAGVGASRAESYPAALAELSGRQVINAGVSGDTTGDGLQRLPAALEAHSPQLVILLLGGNDILRSLGLAEAQRNLATMIELAHAREARVVLLGVPDMRVFSRVAPMYDALAGEYDVLYADTLLAGLLRNPRYKSDPIHLNAAGYRALAAGIHDLLQAQGLLVQR